MGTPEKGVFFVEEVIMKKLTVTVCLVMLCVCDQGEKERACLSTPKALGSFGTI